MSEITPIGSSQSEKPSSADILLSRLDQDRTQAWIKYENIRRRLTKFFEWNHCFLAEELADETLDRVAKKIGVEEIRDFGNFALGIARFVCLENSKKTRRISSVEDHIGGPDSISDARDHEREIVEDVDQQIRLKCLRECLGRLATDEKELAVSYYSAEEKKQGIHRQEIAQKIGVSIIALRVRANRVRDKLEKCVRQCLDRRKKSLVTAWEQGLGV
jgi:RNA polymerase sigma factor (sigma-70 family)